MFCSLRALWARIFGPPELSAKLLWLHLAATTPTTSSKLSKVRW